MADANLVLEGFLKHRYGKKWKSRWCIVRKLSPVADRLHITLYKDAQDAAKGNSNEKAQLAVEEFFGIESGFSLDRENHVMALLCQREVILLAFNTHDSLIQWQIRIRAHLGQEEQYLAKLVKSPSSSRIPVGPVRIYVHGVRICIAANTPPRILAHWKISDLRKFGVIDNKFCIEAGSKCGKTAGVYAFLMEAADQLSTLLHKTSQGKQSGNAPTRRYSSRRRSQYSQQSDWLTAGQCHSPPPQIRSKDFHDTQTCADLNFKSEPSHSSKISSSTERNSRECSDGTPTARNQTWVDYNIPPPVTCIPPPLPVKNKKNLQKAGLFSSSSSVGAAVSRSDDNSSMRAFPVATSVMDIQPAVSPKLQHCKTSGTNVDEKCVFASHGQGQDNALPLRSARGSFEQLETFLKVAQEESTSSESSSAAGSSRDLTSIASSGCSVGSNPHSQSNSSEPYSPLTLSPPVPTSPAPLPPPLSPSPFSELPVLREPVSPAPFDPAPHVMMTNRCDNLNSNRASISHDNHHLNSHVPSPAIQQKPSSHGVRRSNSRADSPKLRNLACSRRQPITCGDLAPMFPLEALQYVNLDKFEGLDKSYSYLVKANLDSSPAIATGSEGVPRCSASASPHCSRSAMSNRGSSNDQQCAYVTSKQGTTFHGSLKRTKSCHTSQPHQPASPVLPTPTRAIRDVHRHNSCASSRGDAQANGARAAFSHARGRSFESYLDSDSDNGMPSIGECEYAVIPLDHSCANSTEGSTLTLTNSTHSLSASISDKYCYVTEPGPVYTCAKTSSKTSISDGHNPYMVMKASPKHGAVAPSDSSHVPLSTRPAEQLYGGRYSPQTGSHPQHFTAYLHMKGRLPSPIPSNYNPEDYADYMNISYPLKKNGVQSAPVNHDYVNIACGSPKQRQTPPTPDYKTASSSSPKQHAMPYNPDYVNITPQNVQPSSPLLKPGSSGGSSAHTTNMVSQVPAAVVMPTADYLLMHRAAGLPANSDPIFCTVDLPPKRNDSFSSSSFRSRQCSVSSSASGDVLSDDNSPYMDMSVKKIPGLQRSMSTYSSSSVQMPSLAPTHDSDNDLEVDYMELDMSSQKSDSQKHENGKSMSEYICMTPPGDETPTFDIGDSDCDQRHLNSPTKPVQCPFDNLIEHTNILTARKVPTKIINSEKTDAKEPGSKGLLSRLIRRNSSKERKSSTARTPEELIGSLCEPVMENPKENDEVDSDPVSRAQLGRNTHHSMSLGPRRASIDALGDLASHRATNVKPPARSASFSQKTSPFLQDSNLTDEEKQQHNEFHLYSEIGQMTGVKSYPTSPSSSIVEPPYPTTNMVESPAYMLVMPVRLSSAVPPPADPNTLYLKPAPGYLPDDHTPPALPAKTRRRGSLPHDMPPPSALMMFHRTSRALSQSSEMLTDDVKVSSSRARSQSCSPRTLPRMKRDANLRVNIPSADKTEDIFWKQRPPTPIEGSVETLREVDLCDDGPAVPEVGPQSDVEASETQSVCSYSSSDTQSIRSEEYKCSPASTTLRPRFGKEYRKLDRRKLADELNISLYGSPSHTPNSPSCSSSVFTFDGPSISSRMSSVSGFSLGNESPHSPSILRASPQHDYVNVCMPRTNSPRYFDHTPPGSPHSLSSVSEQSNPMLNYAEIDLSISSDSKNRRPRIIDRSSDVEYAMIDMVATAAASKVGKEHAQQREDSLRRKDRSQNESIDSDEYLSRRQKDRKSSGSFTRERKGSSSRSGSIDRKFSSPM